MPLDVKGNAEMTHRKPDPMEYKITFDVFVALIYSNVLEFSPSRPWEVEDWHNAYGDFKESLKSWHESYVETKHAYELIVDWGSEYYHSAELDDQGYQVKRNPQIKGTL